MNYRTFQKKLFSLNSYFESCRRNKKITETFRSTLCTRFFFVFICFRIKIKQYFYHFMFEDREEDKGRERERGGEIERHVETVKRDPCKCLKTKKVAADHLYVTVNKPGNYGCLKTFNNRSKQMCEHLRCTRLQIINANRSPLLLIRAI